MTTNNNTPIRTKLQEMLENEGQTLKRVFIEMALERDEDDEIVSFLKRIQGFSSAAEEMPKDGQDFDLSSDEIEKGNTCLSSFGETTGSLLDELGIN